MPKVSVTRVYSALVRVGVSVRWGYTVRSPLIGRHARCIQLFNAAGNFDVRILS